jgi:hypothetical protein
MEYRPSDRAVSGRQVLAAWLVCFGVAALSLLPALWRNTAALGPNGETPSVAHSPPDIASSAEAAGRPEPTRAGSDHGLQVGCLPVVGRDAPG